MQVPSLGVAGTPMSLQSALGLRGFESAGRAEATMAHGQQEAEQDWGLHLGGGRTSDKGHGAAAEWKPCRKEGGWKVGG